MPRLNAPQTPYVIQIDPKNPTEIVTALSSTVDFPGEPDELVFDAVSILTLVSDRGAATFDFTTCVLAVNGEAVTFGEDPVDLLNEQKERLRVFKEAIDAFVSATESQIDGALAKIESFLKDA